MIPKQTPKIPRNGLGQFMPGISLGKTPIQERFDSKWTPEPFSGCHIWHGCRTRQGYGMIMLENRTMTLAPRVSWELKHGKIPDGLCVLHQCDVPSCVNPNHLFLGTKSDNSQDAARKMRSHNRWGKPNLSREQIYQIRESELTQTETAKLFGISAMSVSLIKSRKRWRHI